MPKQFVYIKAIFPTLIFSLFAITGFGQKDFSTEKTSIPGISFHYGHYTPMGDLADRFGTNNGLGGSFIFKDKNNFLYGFKGTFLFGDNVKERDILSNIVSDNGEVFDKEARISKLLFLERGYTFSPTFGKVFNVLAKNPNSGIFVTGGVGFFSHKIRIEHQENEIPQLEEDYIKGYDRLCRGLSLNQSVGYFNLSNKRLTNFYVAVDFHQAFTKRAYPLNFNNGVIEDQSRTDMMIGLKVGWIFLLYKRMANDYYYQ